jgi:hypothetical protein
VSRDARRSWDWNFVCQVRAPNPDRVSTDGIRWFKGLKYFKRLGVLIISYDWFIFGEGEGLNMYNE